MNKFVFGLLTLTATTGLIGLPADADEAIIQQSNQVTTLEGNGNTSYQNATQTNLQIRNRKGRERRRSSGLVQRSEQDVYHYGSDNYGEQVTEQNNVQIDNSNTRGRGCRRYCR